MSDTDRFAIDCECGWHLEIFRHHPAVHLVDHYTYDCPLRRDGGDE